MRTQFFTLLAFFLSAQLFAQTGTIQGTVLDNSLNTPVDFATVQVEGTSMGAYTDETGNYTLQITPGTYTVKVSFVGFSEFLSQPITVTEGSVTPLEIRLKANEAVFQEVIIAAKAIKNTENSVMAMQRLSTAVMDGVSSQTFKKTGDSDVGQAIKRVTGVSVVDGKDIYVRGLGDRYTKTLFNNMDVPGLDPDKNSVSVDIFPTNIVDNVLVYKTFSPEFQGDFTGGLVNITTKDFPDSKTLNVTMGATYTPTMHFNNNFLSYKGGATDFLGYDNGSRALFFDKNQNIPELSNSAENKLIPYFTSNMNRQMAAQRNTNDLNKNLSVSYGNQKKVGGMTLGFVAAANYRNGSTYYDNAEYQEYILRNDKFFINRSSVGQVGTQSTFWNVLAGVTAKYKNNRIGFQYMKMQNGESTASKFFQRTYETNPADIQRDNLEYVERSVNNFLLNGTHQLNDDKWTIDWRVMPTIATVAEPDMRVAGFEVVQGTADSEPSYEIRPAVGADVSRIWRNLRETNLSSKVDVKYAFTMKNGLASTFKFGAANTLKARAFEVNSYVFRVRQQSQLNLNGNADALFYGENIWTPSTDAGTYIRGNYEPANSYTARQQVWAGYAMNELPLTQKLKAIYGLRVEQVFNFYTGQSNDGQRVLNDSKVLDELDFLPSMNFVYNLKENMNLRLSGTRTLARPSFKEKSLAQIQDRISGRTYLGNLDLVGTKVNNLDLRWEYFFAPSEMVSFSGFYKHFQNPIELVAYDAVAPNNFQPKNGKDTDLYGLEFEVRKNLVGNFNAGFNATFVHSAIQVDGQSTRPLVGQSPYIINGQLGYDDSEKGFNANLNYNVQGERLYIVGIGGVPPVYEQAFHALNFRMSQKFGLNRKWTVALGAANILNQARRMDYKNEGEANKTFQYLKPGRSYSVSVGRTF